MHHAFIADWYSYLEELGFFLDWDSDSEIQLKGSMHAEPIRGAIAKAQEVQHDYLGDQQYEMVPEPLRVGCR